MNFTTAELLACRPQLLRYAVKLARNRDYAEDLVQEALTRAIACESRFEVGSCLIAWVTIILRNAFFSDLRKQHCIMENVDSDEVHKQLITDPAQESSLELRDVERILSRNYATGAAVTMLALGFSSDQAAELIGCGKHTVKSRARDASKTLRLAGAA
jgi:RNA polymerase sigma-70 factor (ECF subfamily)